jgi:hypothetical protein
MLSLIRVLLLGALATFLVLAADLPVGPGSVALAEDDDASDDDFDWLGEAGDDDEDEDDDDGPRRPAASPPPPPVALALPSEIVLAPVTEAELALILADGFSVVASAPAPLLGGLVARLELPPAVDLDAARLRLSAIAPGASVDLNHLYRPLEMPCWPGDCLAFEMIGWAVPPTSCGLDTTIAMIDTRVNLMHEALADRSVEVISMLGAEEARSEAIHGTAIATLLVGSPETRTPGLLPEARLVAVEAFHGDAAGDAADVFKIVRALDALALPGIRIVNLSFAGPANLVLERTVTAASASGMTIVAAAGNAGPLAAPVYPAAYEPVVAVTAVDRRLEVYRQAGRGAHLAFAAPGVNVWTAASISGGRFRSGTSYATPFVSAALALAAARDEGSTSAELVADLAQSSIDLGEAGRDPVFGWGLVNAPVCPVLREG